MVHIAPFKGVLYDKEKVGNIELVIAPPYDAISPELQKELYDRSPYNVIRLILNKEKGHKKYTQAAEFLQKWIDEGVLKASPLPALYLYEQRYKASIVGEPENEIRVRRGIIARAKLEDFSSGKILPHEHTHKRAKTDRMHLMEETKSNLCQIFSFYSDVQGTIDYFLEETANNKKPLLDIRDEHGIEHLLWDITDPKVISAISAQIEKCPIFIADGHHRYETSLEYRDRRRAENPNWTEDDAYNYTAMMLVNMDSADLTILSIHRMIRHLKDFDMKKLLTVLEEFFDVKEVSTPKRHNVEDLLLSMRNNDSKHRFGIYGGNNKFYLLTLKDSNILSQINISKKSSHWQKLDVAILHSILIDHILKAGEQEWSEDHITYTIDPKQAVKLVDEGQYQLAVFLNPTRVEQVREVARAGEKMPQKSTFFYPKILSGLVINRFED